MKVLRIDSAWKKSMKGYWGFKPLLPHRWSNLGKYLKNSNFCGKETNPKFALFVQLWPPDSSPKMAEIKKVNGRAEKLQPSGYPNISKSRLYLLSPFREKYNYILHYLGYFWHETGRGHKSKGQGYFDITQLIPGQLLVKKFPLSSFAAIGHKRFQVWLLFLVPSLNVWK